MNKTNLQRLKEGLKKMLSKELSKPYVKKESAIGDPNLAQGGFNAGNGFSTNCWECDDVELKNMVGEIIKEVMSEKKYNQPNEFDEFARRMRDHDWYGYMSDSLSVVDQSERDFRELVEMATELAKVDPEKVIAIWKSTPDATKESDSDYIKSLFQQFRNSKQGSQPLKERLKAALKPLVLEFAGKYLYISQFREKRKDGTRFTEIDRPKLSDINVDDKEVYFTDYPKPPKYGSTWKINTDGTISFLASNYDTSG